MKRFALLLLVVMTVWTGCASAWEPSAELVDFAAQVVPGYALVDGCIYDETAMLLLEDEDGLTCFAGCVRTEEDWIVTLSTPFPEWLDVALDTYHAGDGSMWLWTDRLPEMRDDEDEILDIYIELTADGVWQVWGVNNGWDVIEFCRHSVRNMNFDYFGDVTIPRDIARIDWAALPFSFQEAMELADTSRWRIAAAQYAPVFAAPDTDSAIIGLGMSGAPVQVVSAVEDMVEVQFIGRSETGWMLEGDLLPGSEQMTRYDLWYNVDSNAYGRREIILEDSDPTVSWYDVPHEDSTAVPFVVDSVEYVTVLGWCPNVCCYHLYSETLGTSGYVPLDQLPYTLE